MIVHSLLASLSFDYQGERHDLQSLVNIAEVIDHEDFFRSVYLQLAKSIEIDVYSYQFEVMMDQNIQFSAAKGCAQGCLEEGALDLTTLRKNFEQASSDQIIRVIIDKYFRPEEVRNDMKKALTEAFRMGKASIQKPD